MVPVLKRIALDKSKGCNLLLNFQLNIHFILFMY
jgi:hypothetical protein